MTDSQKLLLEYAKDGSEAAFGELVTRYLDLVYSAAFRLAGGDAQLAEDVSQTVFVDLARKAQTLPSDIMLGGWLHQHTCFVAAKVVRTERRRQARERQALEMNALQDHSTVNFLRIAPILDEAIGELAEPDRTAVLLRFFEQHDFRHIGEMIGSSEDAARMRVNRALEKLELLLKRRGVTSSAAALSVALSANAVQAAPVGLAATISTAALTGATITTGSALITATKTVTMTALQKTLIAATLAAAILAGISGARQTSKVRAEVEALKKQQVPLEERIQRLTHERDSLARRLAALRDDSQNSNLSSSEVLKLRGQVAGLRQQLADNRDPQTQTAQEALTSARAYYQRAMKHYFDHEYEAELADLNKAIEMDPNLAEAFFARASLYDAWLPKKYGGEERALPDYNRVLDLNPNDCSARHNRALCFEHFHQYDNAIADYTTLIEGNTDFSHVTDRNKQLALEYLYRGRAYQWFKQDYAKAVADYNEALRLDPGVDGGHRLRGQCYEQLGQADKAQADFAVEKPN